MSIPDATYLHAPPVFSTSHAIVSTMPATPSSSSSLAEHVKELRDELAKLNSIVQSHLNL